MIPSRAAAVVLWLSLVFPSTFVVHKYTGWTGVVVYALIAAVIVALPKGLPTRLPIRTVDGLALATFLVIVMVFLAAYPTVNTHEKGKGSDDDDGINVGVAAMLAGDSPYTRTSYLGNVLHHFAGAFVLAAPFVLLGTSALQNLFWLPAFFLAVREERDGRTALLLAWLVLALSPTVMHQIVTGTSYLSNTIYVLLGLWWLLRTEHRDVAALGWGVALASRANFLFLVPLGFGWLRQHAGWRVALRASALTCLMAGCLIVPFYLHDPLHFGPLDAADRLLTFDTIVPHLGAVLIGSTALLAIGLSLTAMDESALFRNCALVQAFPVLAGVVLSSIQEGQLELWYAPYGTFFAWFALMAIVAKPDAPNCAPARKFVGRERAAAARG